MDCVFCKIVNGEIPSEIVYNDDNILAFKDVNPQAPIHLLIIPKKHITSILEISNDDESLLFQILKVAQKIAKDNDLDSKGFRLVVNTGVDGGQTVPHLHFHLLGGRQLKWPPG